MSINIRLLKFATVCGSVGGTVGVLVGFKSGAHDMMNKPFGRPNVLDAIRYGIWRPAAYGVLGMSLGVISPLLIPIAPFWWINERRYQRRQHRK